MAVLIFEDWDHVRPYAGTSHTTNDLSTLEAGLYQALETHILPYLGTAAWDFLLNLHNIPSGDSQAEYALAYARRALVNLAYYEQAKEGGIQVTDTGFGQAQNPEMRAPFQWQMRMFMQQKWEAGTNALGALLGYMEDNKGYFTAWTGSAAQVEYAAFFIRDLKVYNRYRRIADYGTLLALRPYMLRIQNAGFADSITEDLWETIKTEWIGTPTADISKLFPYVQEIIAHRSLYHALYELSFSISAQGFRINGTKADAQNSQEEKAALEEIARAKNYLQAAGDAAMSRLVKYLADNASGSKYIPFYEGIMQVRATDGNEIEAAKNALKEGPTFML